MSKNGKSAGTSRILPEIITVACADDFFLTQLLDLVHSVWEERSFPKDWANAVLVPIPTTHKGNLISCDNWRGIAFWTWLEKLKPPSFKQDYKILLRRYYQSHNMVSAFPEAAQI